MLVGAIGVVVIMAASSKKRRVENDHESSSSSESSEDEGMETEHMSEASDVQVEFEARVPDDSDYHGIRRLLQQLFLKAHVNVGEIADTVIKQDYMGSVLKQSIRDEEDSDDDQTYGVFSVIDITQRKNMACVQQICSYLLDHCKRAASPETFERFRALLHDAENHVGLILSERFVNIPPQISVPLYDGLGEEMKKAKEEKKLSEFAYYVLISKYFEDDGSDDQEVIYANAEEELFDEDAVLKFDFSVANEQDSVLAGRWRDSDTEWKPKRRIMVFPSEKWNVLVQKLKTEVVPVT